MTADPGSQETERRLDALMDQMSDLIRRSLYRSAMDLAVEVKRLARGEERLISYLHGIFHEIDLSKDLLDPDTTRVRAVELIALLESQDQARRVQSDYSEPDYASTVGWMSACAYENFAEATALSQGYNSEGMHGCITAGIQVCQRTGKLQCLTCFREYATSVYSAADDLDMALHHARSVAAHQGPKNQRGDRRWLGAYDESWLQLLQGHVEAAEETARRSWTLSQDEGVGVKLSARQRALTLLEVALLMAGKHDGCGPPSTAGRIEEGDRTLPRGEYPAQDLRWDLRDALAACCRQDYDAALTLLTYWDRWLTDHHCLHDWFEVRLRLLAVYRLAARPERIVPLAKQLDARGRKARDWLTLRRLARLLDTDKPPTPLALLGPATSGPFASSAASAPPVSAPAAEPASAPQEAVDEVQLPGTPLDDVVRGLIDRLESAREDPALGEAVLADLLALQPAQVTHPVDAARLLHVGQYLVGAGQRAEELWRWAETVAAPHSQNAVVLNLLAVLGDLLRGSSNDSLAGHIPNERVDRLFRQSLDLDPENAGNFARAGAYYLSEENLGEAERCLARGFRLQRTNSFLTLRLAEVYNRTDRPRDALAVLDLCLREGGSDPAVAWEAALAAVDQEQYEALLTYLERFEALQPGQPWTNYYRAVGLIELGSNEQALEALAEEERRGPDHALPVVVLRALANANLGRLDACRQHLEELLATRLASAGYLTLSGLQNLAARAWKAASHPPQDAELCGRLSQRLFEAGLVPGDFFESARRAGKALPNLVYYRVTVRQPLDESWPHHPGCLAGQELWRAYRASWGVLASDENEAQGTVLGWQTRCFSGQPAAVEEVEVQEEGYEDRPGVVWQGPRWSEAAAQMPAGEQPEE